MRTLILLFVTFALAFGGALASGCTPTTSPAVVTAPTPDGDRYIAWDFCVPISCDLSIWGYQESNGIPGLQRADESVDDTCNGQIAGDTLVF